MGENPHGFFLAGHTHEITGSCKGYPAKGWVIFSFGTCLPSISIYILYPLKYHWAPKTYIFRCFFNGRYSNLVFRFPKKPAFFPWVGWFWWQKMVKNLSIPGISIFHTKFFSTHRIQPWSWKFDKWWKSHSKPPVFLVGPIAASFCWISVSSHPATRTNPLQPNRSTPPLLRPSKGEVCTTRLEGGCFFYDGPKIHRVQGWSW